MCANPVVFPFSPYSQTHHGIVVPQSSACCAEEFNSGRLSHEFKLETPFCVLQINQIALQDCCESPCYWEQCTTSWVSLVSLSKHHDMLCICCFPSSTQKVLQKRSDATCPSPVLGKTIFSRSVFFSQSFSSVFCETSTDQTISSKLLHCAYLPLEGNPDLTTAYRNYSLLFLCHAHCYLFFASTSW